MTLDVEYEIKQIKKRLDVLEHSEQQADFELNEFHDFKEAFFKGLEEKVEKLLIFKDNMRDS